MPYIFSLIIYFFFAVICRAQDCNIPFIWSIFVVDSQKLSKVIHVLSFKTCLHHIMLFGLIPVVTWCYRTIPVVTWCFLDLFLLSHDVIWTDSCCHKMLLRLWFLLNKMRLLRLWFQLSCDLLWSPCLSHVSLFRLRSLLGHIRLWFLLSHVRLN